MSYTGQIATLKQQLEYTAEAFTKASHHCINMDIQIGGLNGNRTYDETYKALLNLKQQLAQMTQERDKWNENHRVMCRVEHELRQQLASMTLERDLLNRDTHALRAEIEDWRKKKKGKP